MCGVVLEFEAVPRLHRLAILFEQATHAVRRPGEAAHRVALASYPVGLARGGAFGDTGEQYLAGDLNLDGAARASRQQLRAQRAPEPPCCFCIEGCKAQQALLSFNHLQVFRRRHSCLRSYSMAAGFFTP